MYAVLSVVKLLLILVFYRAVTERSEGTPAGRPEG